MTRSKATASRHSAYVSCRLSIPSCSNYVRARSWRLRETPQQVGKAAHLFLVLISREDATAPYHPV